MSDSTSTTDSTTTTDTAAVVTTDTQVVQGDPAELGDGGKKALEAERRRASAAEREAKSLKARLDQIEAANLSDLEKAQKAANEATAQLAEFQSTVVRQKVALSKGVPAELVDRLRGATEDEISADADALLALINKAPTTPGTPKPDLSQGAQGGALPLNGDGLEQALRSKLNIR